MLNDNSFRSFGVQGGSSRVKNQSLAFIRSEPLWNKCKGSTKENIEPSSQIQSKQRYKFYKTGKTFGFETSRYVQFNNGILYYFQNENDTKCKGYCNLQNVYMKYSKIQSGYELYLTNGKASSSLIFNKNDFFANFEKSLVKSVIQLNFKDKYFIADLIGTGTFAKVYSAINIMTKIKYAVKVMPKIDSNGFQTKQIVQEEKKILKNLDSKNICKMEEFFEDSESYIFVLEYLEGRDLNLILKESTREIPLGQKIAIMKSALNGLVDLHQKNIIHRDLKPHNIMVNLKNSTTKIVDFGLSLLYDNKTQIDKFIRCGTMGYIAPEIVNNNESCRKPYCCKSDMYGFGVIAHMLLMGSNPLRAKTYKETVERNLKGEVSLNEKQIKQIYGSECFYFLESLLRKDPSKRCTAEQALKSEFLNTKHEAETSQFDIKCQNDENEEINCIGGRQFGGKSKNEKLQSSNRKRQKSYTATKTSRFYGLS